MILYHPAFDIYNCVFRILQLLTRIQEDEVEVDRLRIWDFYLVFPKEAAKITFPQDMIQLKSTIFKEKQSNPYEDLVDPRRIIERMKSYQLAALKCLASYGFIEKDALTRSIVKKTNKEIPLELKDILLDISLEKENIIKLVTGFWELPLFGEKGLKARTGLIDFKYDVR